MSIVPEKIYAIYDKEKGEYWATRNGKSAWMKPGHAKNAFHASAPTRQEFPAFYYKRWSDSDYYHQLSFNDQSRFVVHEFELTVNLAKEVK